MATYREVIDVLAADLDVPKSILAQFWADLATQRLIASGPESKMGRPCRRADAVVMIGAILLTDDPSHAATAVAAHPVFMKGLQSTVANMIAIAPPPNGATIQCSRRNGALAVMSYMSARSIYVICKMCQPQTDGAAD